MEQRCRRGRQEAKGERTAHKRLAGRRVQMAPAMYPALAPLLCMLWLIACSALREAGARSMENFAPLALPPASAKRIPILEGGFIYPLLPFGPGNQLVGLREALVLGRLFKRTVVIHEIVPLHYDDEKIEGGHGGTRPLDFDMLYDLDHLSRHQSVVTQAELQAKGWNGHLDIVASVGKRFFEEYNLNRFRLLNISWDEDTPFMDFHNFNCTTSDLRRMAEPLSKSKYAGFALYQTAVPDTGAACFRLKATGHVCHDLYLQVSLSLVRSPYILDIVRRFREQSLGGANAPYLAVHIRPYEDRCMEVWKKEPYNDTRASEMCKNGNLYNVFVQQTLEQMQKLEQNASSTGLSLFVMAHPVLRPIITKLYEQADLHPVYYNMPDLEDVVGFRSLSLLGMVEEEIATQADYFLGSHVSSMTATVLQDRFARGKSFRSAGTFGNSLSKYYPEKKGTSKSPSKGSSKRSSKRSKKTSRKALSAP
ncbi:hypothetical protein HYH03_006519 [Edaphochlamys debaryana]|uniref:O-fucosyltransferase family protein n=1 Tax=Edaphochlamys debaryana TaxID=47281 RepID=A0A835Y6V4_9CHLO|nr:hypothetical protein HYH03_006519 [Edaphochlamys debaryana]|eukprot:KAG2495246.1 hypothetical protein HYH03_006519 [Edaphochlamys debaryana]